ncbi:MAG: hypothetical protein K6D92_07020 [Erysipelotrichaceae bacterium]|nr:hypothetical protein [Erysipelotrichaceae bacterium]
MKARQKDMKKDDTSGGIMGFIMLALVLAWPLFMGFAIIIPVAFIAEAGLLIYASRIK